MTGQITSKKVDVQLIDRNGQLISFQIGFDENAKFFNTDSIYSDDINSYVEITQARFDDDLVICGDAWRDIECSDLLEEFLSGVILSGKIDADNFIEMAFRESGASGQPGHVL